MTKDKRDEVKAALEIYRRREVFDREMQERAIKTLVDHGCWSGRQIVKITGAPDALVRMFTTKTDRTGGRFNPDTLELIQEAIVLRDSNDWNPYLIRAIHERGTSLKVLALLLGASVSTVKWQADKA